LGDKVLSKLRNASKTKTNAVKSKINDKTNEDRQRNRKVRELVRELAHPDFLILSKMGKDK